ncbi:MAG: S8 family serine peptidase [Acidobacteria bacterium]|nr:S8 family serine peptidase [Acidobacteriota bacterium]
MGRRTACWMVLTGLLTGAALAAGSDAPWAPGPVRAARGDAGPPALAWSGPALAWAVDVSLDDFRTVFYSTLENGGEVLREAAWALPGSLWEYLRRRDGVKLRVRPLDDRLLPGPAGAPFRLPAALGKGGAEGAEAARAVDDFFHGYSQSDKLRRRGPSDAWLADEVLVELFEQRGPVPREALDTAFPVERVVTALGREYIRMQVAPGESVRGAASRLRRVPGIRSAQPNHIAVPCITVTDPQLPLMQWAPQKVKADVAWANDVTGSGVVVAVLDTGIFAGHQEFAGTDKVLAGPDFGDNDADPSDTDGHGTQVAGIIAANADGVGSVGIAPGATLLPVKVFDSSGGATVLNLVRGIHYAAVYGARVINLSMGSANVFQYLPDPEPPVDVFTNAVADAVALGATVVSAAGNDASDLPNWARAPSGGIAVGATKPDDRLAAFTNIGPDISVTAPGWKIYAPYWYSGAPANGYTFMNGTSASCAVVSGAAALVLEQNPDYTPAKVKELLESTADDLGPTGFDPFYGNGRLNLASALGFAAGSDTTPAWMVSMEDYQTRGDAMVIRFSRNMLADGSANAVNNRNNWAGFTETFANFLANADSYIWNSTALTLTINANSSYQLVTDGLIYPVALASNVRDSAGRPVGGDFVNEVPGPPDFTSASVPTHQYSPFSSVSYSINDIEKVFAHAIAYDNETITVFFNQPVTRTSAQSRANYSLRLSPTYGGTSKTNFLDTIFQGGSVISLLGTTRTYDDNTRMLTISGIGTPLTAGNTFGLRMTTGITNVDLLNPIAYFTDSTQIRPMYGVVRQASSVTPSIVSTRTYDAAGNPNREVVEVSFSRAMKAQDVLRVANWSLTVAGEGSPRDLSACTVTYDPGFMKAWILGVNLHGDGGKNYTVTATGMDTADGVTLASPNNSATGTVTADAGAALAPSITEAFAYTDAVEVYFGYQRKVLESSVENLANIALESPIGTPVPLGSKAPYEAVYDPAANSLRINSVDLSNFLVAGDTFQVTFSNVVAAMGPATPLGAGNPASGIVGPNAPLAITLLSLEAVRGPAGVLITWETATELGTAGFEIWRADGVSDQFVKVSGSLIPAEGSEALGAPYAWLDGDAVPGVPYRYQLAEVENNGNRLFYGPVEVTE